MKKTFCRVMGLLLTLCLLVGMLSYLGELTRLKGDTNLYEGFPKAAAQCDVLFLGNSHMWDGVFPMELWAEYGITSYNLAFSAAFMSSVYWILCCALDRAAPSVVVVDCYMISNPSTLNLPFLQDAMASIPFSFNKVRAAFDLCPPWEHSMNDTFSLIWSFSQFHNRWPELTPADFHSTVYPSYGAYPLINVEQPNSLYGTDETLTLDETYPNVLYLRRIAEECQKRDIRLVLTMLPFPASQREAAAANGVESLARELGVDYLNLIGIDVVEYQTDMFDSSSHLNVSGALKATRFLGEYLREECGLPDHRGDPVYAAWDTDYLLWRQELTQKLEEQRVLQRSLMLLSDPNYASVIRLAPGSPLFQDVQAKPLLENLCGGAALPGFDEAAAAGQSYLLLSNQSLGIVAEAVGSDVMDTPLGTLRVEPERSRLALEDKTCSLSAEGDQSASDAMCFVFTADLDPLPACSHAFALTGEGVYERSDY